MGAKLEVCKIKKALEVAIESGEINRYQSEQIESHIRQIDALLSNIGTIVNESLALGEINDFHAGEIIKHLN